MMKKQILFLTFMVLAVMAGITKSYGQVKNTDIKVWAGPNCTGDATTPAAGEEYTYRVEIPTTYAGYNGDGTYDWYVTQDVNLLTGAVVTAGTEFTVAGTGSGYHIATPGTGTSDQILITWTAAAIATAAPYYLVVKYTETNTSGDANCATENIKVFVIEPQNTFWLDIDPATAADVNTIPTDAVMQAVGYSFDICAAPVKSAIITAATPTVEYIYDDNILYAVIHAAGYTGDWDATLKVSGLEDNQQITSITWNGTAWTPAATGNDAMGNGSYTGTLPATNGGTDIIVAITIANNQHEGLADQNIRISIDGSYTSGTTTFNDLSDATAACSVEAADADYVVQTIKARPTVNPINPTDFVTPAPALR